MHAACRTAASQNGTTSCATPSMILKTNYLVKPSSNTLNVGAPTFSHMPVRSAGDPAAQACYAAKMAALPRGGVPMTSAKKGTKRPSSMPKSAKPSAKPDHRVELLFEIGAEEIPAGMLPRAVSELQAILERHLAAENYQQGVTIETFGGPRRLTAWVRGLVAKQADVENEVTGPPKSVAYDATRRRHSRRRQLRRAPGRPAPSGLSGANSQGRIHRRQSHQTRPHAPTNCFLKFCPASSTTSPGRAP